MNDRSRGETVGGVTDIAIVILTYNEEANIAQAVRSVRGWAKQVFVFDSFSTDRTVEIARELGCEVVQHRFEDYGKQRNASLDLLPIQTEWVFFLDADEWLPSDLKHEISTRIAERPRENGFYAKRRFIWEGRWVRRGYYPVWILRLFRHGKGRCEDRAVNEHIIVDGDTGRLRADFIHEDHSGVDAWIAKHIRYAAREAAAIDGARDGEAEATPFGSQAQRARWLRHRVWNELPPLVRPFIYFTYRTVIRGGVLDGASALSYHVLQALWFPILVDLKYLEMKRARRREGESLGS
jgi:glycosyltransferase involved in cell wall biosynthesis